MKKTCVADVHDWFGVSFHKCGVTAKYEYEGKLYCGTHYPLLSVKVRKSEQKKCDYEYEGGGICGTRVTDRRFCGYHQMRAGQELNEAMVRGYANVESLALKAKKKRNSLHWEDVLKALTKDYDKVRTRLKL
jgi:hypothetical protein